jgi:hypothetical protein
MMSDLEFYFTFMFGPVMMSLAGLAVYLFAMHQAKQEQPPASNRPPAA